MKSKPLISIITVVYNGEKFLEKTIQSVINQTYKNIEYIIIDGGSTDGTVDIIKKYEKYISHWVSESDEGIYDAMNKGIEVANGEWLNFMNAGDEFYNPSVLDNVFNSSDFQDYDFIYSDVLLSNGKRIYCDIGKNSINHQALFYKKEMHSIAGLYLVSENLLISDYLFFMLCKNRRWYKTSHTIAIYDTTGISGNQYFINHFKQKMGVDLMFNNIAILKSSRALITYPLMKKIKNYLHGFFNEK